MYKLTDQDRTPEGIKNLYKNYHVMATYMGGFAQAKTSEGSTKVYKVENFFVEGINNEEDISNILRSEIFGMPYGIYLEPRNIKRAAPALFNIFNEDEQMLMKEANLPEDAIELMKTACFDIMEQHRGLGKDESKKDKNVETAEGVADQEAYDKYYKTYDEMNRNEIADLIVEEGWETEFGSNPKFSSKANCIKFYILHKHKIKPALTGD